MKKLILLFLISAGVICAQTAAPFVQRAQLLTSGRVPYVTANGLVTDSSNLTFNSGTGALTATTFVGAVTGNASTATALLNVRTIGGSNFDGTANVTSFPSPGAIGGTTPAAGTFTTGVFGSTTSLLLGTAGSAVGNIGFRNATSGTATLAPPTGALGTYSVTLPNAASTLPIFGQQITFAGPTAARTVTLLDAVYTTARQDAAQTFTGIQSFTSPDFTTSVTTPSTSFTAWAGATTLLTFGGTGASASTFFPSTLDTSSSVTGAIRTSGGISAAKALNIGTTGIFGTSVTSPIFSSNNADPADSGIIRLGNAESIAWEASPASTDVTLTVNSSEQFVFSNDILNPSLATSLLTSSTTFALLNTTATTVNAFGAATTVNTGASATQIWNFGGSTTASEFRFLEPSGSGTNYTAFKAVAQSANITYSLPAIVGGAGTFLRDAAGNGVLDWAVPTAAAAGSDTYVQFNDGGTALGGDAGMVYNKTTDKLTVAGDVTAASFTGSGTTPAAMSLIAGTGSIPALTANSAGWAAPATGGTAWLGKLPATITAGYFKFAAPASNDGVNESAVTSVSTIPAADIAVGALADGITATTQAARSADTKLATDAYANAAGNGQNLGTWASPDTTAGSITWANAPVYIVWTSASGAARTYTLPAASTYAGKAIVLTVVVGTNNVNIKPASGEKIILDGTQLAADHKVQFTTSAAGNRCSLICDGATWEVFSAPSGTLVDGGT